MAFNTSSIFRKWHQVSLLDGKYSANHLIIPRLRAIPLFSFVLLFPGLRPNARDCSQSILYLDSWKAFDSVDHSILLQKLKCHGVTGKLLDWFCDWSSTESNSWWCDDGPLLHLECLKAVFLDRCYLSSLSKLFAHDTKIYRGITSVSDCGLLQRAFITNLAITNLTRRKIQTIICDAQEHSNIPWLLLRYRKIVKSWRGKRSRNHRDQSSNKLTWDST